MNIVSIVKKILFATAIVAVGVGIFLVHALAGLGASPVVFADPPAFVEAYAAEMNQSIPSPSQGEAEPGSGQEATSEPTNITKDFFKEALLVRNVILNGESPAEVLRLFTHPEKEKRVKIASAFAHVNGKLSHDEVSGFDDKRNQFWEDAKDHIPAIQNAFFEALIMSAKEGTATRIPYTLAWWMPGQDHKRDQMLAWAAKHHPDPWVRRFSVFFVVEYGVTAKLAGPLLQNRTHDPVFRVRKEVLDQRIRRLIAEFWENP